MALSVILSGGCAGFSRSEEGYQSQHQTEGPKTQASGPVPVLGAVVSPDAPSACPVTPLSFHLSHFRYPPLPSPHWVYLQCRHYPELKAELRQALLLMEPSELGAGVKHTRKKTLERL